MLLSGIVEHPSRSHSPFKGVAGKQTFLEKPYNEKEYSQDDMSLKDERDYRNFKFSEEPYVPVAVAKKHISLMESDMRRMKENYGKTMKDLETGYLKLEEKTREIYKRTLSVWRNKAKNKIKQFQDALKKAIEERDEIEVTLKERIRKLRIEKDRLDKEKVFLLSENEAGREQIQEKAKLLEDIKSTYQIEIKEKEKVIDEREERIEKMKDEHEQDKIKLEDDKKKIIEENEKKISELKEKLEKETNQNEILKKKCDDLEASGVVVADTGLVVKQKTKLKGQDIYEEEKSDESNIQNLLEVRDVAGEGTQKVNAIPVAASATGVDSRGGARRTETLSGGVIVASTADTKELLERIDKLETENLRLQEDKKELAKAIKDMHEVLKEAKRVEKIHEHQINDAERQGAEIIPAEVVEERNKAALKRKKTKKGKKVEDKGEDEDEIEVFAGNQELKKMVDDLVPEENRDDNIEDAERIMMIQTSKDEELVKKVELLSKENSLLKKSLEELNNRKTNVEEGDIDSLREQNSAFIMKIKSLNKKIEELKERPSVESVGTREESAVINSKIKQGEPGSATAAIVNESHEE